MSIVEILTCVALVLTSGFLSSSEVALFSLSRFQLRAIKDESRADHRRIKALLTDPGGLLITILFFNEIINISLSTLITTAVSRSTIGETHTSTNQWIADTLYGLLYTMPIVLLFCEMTPKVIGARANELLAPRSARILTGVYRLMTPLRFISRTIVALFSNSLNTVFGPKGSKIKNTGDEALPNKPLHTLDHKLKESEFLLMLEEGKQEGIFHSNEVELIKNVFDLDDTPVSEIATPINLLQAVSEHTTLKTALHMARQFRFSRIPVLDEGKSRVVGVLYAKDLLRAKLHPELLTETVVKLMRRPLTVSPHLKLNALFRRMKSQKSHLAVVVASDSGDKPLGVVTMNDVLEALFEDVFPEDHELRDKLPKVTGGPQQ